MSKLRELMRQASKDAERLERLERALSKAPSTAVRLQAATAAKRLRRTEDQVQQIAKRFCVDVVRYRIEALDDEYPTNSITDSLSTFQRAVSAVYDARLNGPKLKYSPSAEVAKRSALGFGYSFSGSKGFVLTAENQRDFFQGEMDETIDAIFDFLDITSPDDAIEASRHLGLGAISSLYSWVKSNAKWQLSVDYHWLRSDDLNKGRFIHRDHFWRLKAIFESVKEVENLPFEARGVLVGIDFSNKSFHFSIPGGESIKGKFSDSFSSEAQTVPDTYLAIMTRVATRFPSTGKETIDYYLNELR